jgi:MFS family permease
VKNERSLFKVLQPWLIWGLGASFFFAEYFARVDPSIIAADLMKDFNVGAFALGSLSALFYYPYIAMQLPVGSLVDRYGPHKLMTVMALVCGVGAMLFSFSTFFWMAGFARMLMGFSAAFAFVGTLKLATVWFEPRKLGLLAGLTQGSGMLGAAVGSGGFAFLVSAFGWRHTIFIIGLILLVIGVLIGFFVNDRKPASHVHETVHIKPVSILEGLKTVFRNPQSWCNAAYVGLLYAPTGAFAELWGPSFMHRVYGISNTEGSLMISLVFVGWAIGGPLVGWLSDAIGKRRPILFASAALSAVLLTLILFVYPGSGVGLPLLMTSMVLYGVCNTGVAISYAVAGEINPLPTAGASVAFANMASIAVAAILQQLLGFILSNTWSGKYVNGIQYYSSVDYKLAMVALPICLVVAFFLVFFIRETNCSRK